MDPIDLQGVNRDGKICHVWACGKCGFAKPSERDARVCCTCRTCGTPMESRGAWESECEPCRKKRYAESDQKREDSAEKLEVWDGGVFYNERYYSSAEAIECDYLEGNEPEWIYVARKVAPPTLDAEEILQNLLENMGDSDGDLYDQLDGVKEFDAACKAFNEANKNVAWYEEDMKRMVRVPKRASEIP